MDKKQNRISSKPANVMLGDTLIYAGVSSMECKIWLKVNADTLESGRYTVTIPEAYVCEIENVVKKRLSFN